MKRISIAALAAAALAVAPAAAQAKIIEVGQTSTVAQPSCPGTDCVAVARTTGYQAKVGTTRSLFTVPANGRIVAWTIQLSQPADNQVTFFNQRFGQPEAGITILRPGKRLFSRVVGQSPLQSLTQWLGQDVQFPLNTTLGVRKGDVIALTVPTWAPALAIKLGKDTSWRAARSGSCNDAKTTSRQTAQTKMGQNTQYRCLYTTARLTYTATLITSPVAPKKPAPKKGTAKNSRARR